MLYQIIFVVLTTMCSDANVNLRKSHRESFGRTHQHFNSKHMFTSDGNYRGYKFRYRVNDRDGNMHYHAQHGAKSGVVRGCYGYTDVNGLYRIVEYIADQCGFRVKIHSQEPGIHRKNPTHVKMDVYSPLTGIGYSSVQHCVDTGTTIFPTEETTDTDATGDDESFTTELYVPHSRYAVGYVANKECPSGQVCKPPGEDVLDLRRLPCNCTFIIKKSQDGVNENLEVVRAYVVPKAADVSVACKGGSVSSSDGYIVQNRTCACSVPRIRRETGDDAKNGIGADIEKFQKRP